MKPLFTIISDPEYRRSYCQKYLSEYSSGAENNEKKAEFYAWSVDYIMSEQCVRDLDRLRNGYLFFDPPRLSSIPKGNGRYRKVYHFDNISIAILSLIARVLNETYDHIFSADLYSYRTGFSRYAVFTHIKKTPGIDGLHCFRADASTYDQTIDGDQLRSLIRKKITDPEMADFLCRFTEYRKYIYQGIEYNDGPAVMAGSSLTPFFDNLYLSDFDEEIAGKCQVYCRYSDDIIAYGTPEQIADCLEYTRNVFSEKHLVLSDAKTNIYSPGEAVEYLSMRICGSKVDISQKLIDDLKSVVSKKTCSLLKIKRQLKLSDEFAMKMALRYIESYSLFFEGFFGNINCTDGLRSIDAIMQNALRTVGSGSFGQGRYRIRYDQLRNIGYRPLISTYYSWEWKKSRK